MRAIRVHEIGGPEVLRLEEVEIAAPGPGEVRVRNHAIGVNFIDVYFRKGQNPTALPFTPGNEGAGEIVSVGEGVGGFKPGDRVAYVGTLGAYAEERNIEAKFVVRLPKAISYDTAAAMMLKGLTAQYLLRQTYKVRAGDTVLVHAAAGGTGLILCQWAKALGAEVIGTVGSPEKAKLAKKAGAKHVILYNEEDFAARVKEITDGRGCDVVYDSVANDTWRGSLKSLHARGLFVCFGQSSGPITDFKFSDLVAGGSLYATRPTLFDYIKTRADLTLRAADLFAKVALGAVKPHIGQRLPLRDAAQAHRNLEARQTTGSTILLP